MSDTIASLITDQSTTMDLNKSLVAVLEGHEAVSQLADPSFVQGWDSLYELCPWSTPFQSKTFVGTWYELFQHEVKPVMVLQMREGYLTGLLTLAINKDGNIIYAGADIAEYQVWLADPDLSQDFIIHAVEALRHTYPRKPLCLHYVPANTPVEGLKQFGCEVLRHKQPILKINYADLALELKKKNRKEKINRLRRLGSLQFCKITDPNEFDITLDELVIQSDFRKGAMFDSCIFKQEPIRKDFLKALFRMNLLHATVLKLDETIIASNVGVFGKGWVHLQGINTHSPMHAKYSPGILHFLMLGLMLAEEEIQVFDLTPGGDSYKHILATDYLEAYEISFYSPKKLLLNALKRNIQGFALTHSDKIGISAQKLKGLKKDLVILRQKLQLVRHYKPTNYRMKTQMKQPGKHILPQKLEQVSPSQTETMRFRVNSLYDLLAYAPKGTMQTRWEFLETAMRRLEAGQQSYSWSENGMLLGCAWVVAPEQSRNATTEPRQIPEDACLIEAVYLSPNAKMKKNQFLAALALQIHKETSCTQVYTSA